MEMCFGLFLAFVATHTDIGWVLYGDDWLFTWGRDEGARVYFAYNKIPGDSAVPVKIVGSCKLENGRAVNLFYAAQTKRK